MIISFTNVIGAIRSLGEAAQVITTNLKMWLGFETSETLGREEVVNGDFSNGKSDWSEEGSSSISVGTYEGKTDVANINILNTSTLSKIEQAFDYVNGQTYQISVEVYLVSGSFRVDSRDGFVPVDFVSTTTTGSWQTLTATITAIQTGTDVVWLRGVNEVSQFYVNSISIKQLTQITPDKSGNNNVGELFTGKALDFDGTEDWVDISGFSMSGNNATFAFWAYIRDDATGDYFFDFHSSSTRFILGFTNTQSSQKLAVYSGGWHDFGDPPQDQWVRIVLTVKGTIAKCFVDGVQLGTDKTISTYDFSSATTVHIGARYTPETFPKWYDGLLSDFQVYDKPWLNDDIAYDYANPQNLVTDSDNTTIALSNLKAYWAMSEGAGSLTYDSSGEGNNGTINGATYEPAQPRIPQLGMMNWSKGSNLLTYSEDFSKWTKNSGGTGIDPVLTANQTDPNNTLRATKIVFNKGTGSSSADLSVIQLSFSSQSNTASVYVRSDSAQRIMIRNSNTWQIYDITNAWVRIQKTDSGGSIQIGLREGYGVSNVPNTSTIYLYGSQVDSGSSASAYRLTDGAATLNSTVIPNPTIPTKDILGNAVRDRLNSFNLDGSGYSSVANNSSIKPTSALSIECWVKTPDVSSASKYISDADVGTTRFFLMQVGSKARFKIATTEIDSATNLTNNSWHYIAGTWDGTTMTLYVDEDTPVTISKSGAITYDTDNLFIGSRLGTGEYFDGLISDVRLYDRALSATEIENNYNAGLSAHTND